MNQLTIQTQTIQFCRHHESSPPNVEIDPRKIESHIFLSIFEPICLYFHLSTRNHYCYKSKYV